MQGPPVGGPCMFLLKLVVIVVTPSVPLPAVSAVVIITVNVASVVANLFLLIAYFVLILAGFPLVALADLVVTSIFQLLQLALVMTQSFPLSVIAERVVVGVRACARNDQSSRQ